MLSVVDNFNPDPQLFAEPAEQERGAISLHNSVISITNNAINDFIEKTIMELKDIIGAEAASSAEFASRVSEQLKSILSSTVRKGSAFDSGDVVATGVDVITDVVGIYGLGGLISGYRTAGFKGALLGGGAGLAANIATAFLLGSFSIVGLPLMVISCAVGTIVSKKVSRVAFKTDIGLRKLNEIRNLTRTNITSSIRDMQINRDIEIWIDKLVDEKFAELVNSMEEECEKMLRDTESSMNEIRKDLTRNEADREQTVRRLNEAEARCLEILEGLKPICKKVEAALTNE